MKPYKVSGVKNTLFKTGHTDDNINTFIDMIDDMIYGIFNGFKNLNQVFK